MKKTIIIPIIFVSVIIFLLVGYFIFDYTVKKITEREVNRITQKEIGRITGQETDKVTQSEIDRITDEIVQQRTEEITRQIMGEDENSAQNEEMKCNVKPKPREFTKSPYYSGPLTDSHVHMPVSSKIVSMVAIQSGFEDMPYEGDIPIDSIICMYENEGIIKTFGFFIMPNAALSSSAGSAKNAKERHKEKIVPFFMPPPVTSLHPKISDVENIISSNKGVFKGIGELAIYHYPSQVKPNDPYFLELYRIANEQHLIIMMHPPPNQQQVVEDIVKAYPNVTFLFHGEESMVNLIGKYPNTYFTIDASETQIYGYDVQHINKKPTKEEWLDHFRKNFDLNLDNSVNKWKTTIEKYPDRFLWGTDGWYGWHFDYEVGGLLEEFSRSFIGQLDPAVQEKFAYKNAERLLQGQ